MRCREQRFTRGSSERSSGLAGVGEPVVAVRPGRVVQNGLFAVNSPARAPAGDAAAVALGHHVLGSRELINGSSSAVSGGVGPCV